MQRGETALHYAVIYNSTANSVKILLQNARFTEMNANDNVNTPDMMSILSCYKKFIMWMCCD